MSQYDNTIASPITRDSLDLLRRMLTGQRCVPIEPIERDWLADIIEEKHQEKLAAEHVPIPEKRR